MASDKVTKAFLALAVAVFLLLTSRQGLADEAPRVAVMFPSKESPGTPAENGLPWMKSLQVMTEDGLGLEAWFSAPKEEGGSVIVFFHGNAGNLRQGVAVARDLSARGYGVLLCEYRGFGGNPGTPSEEGLYKDARACLKWLGAQGYAQERIVLFGWSLGSAVALQAALENPPRALVLLSTFSRVAEVMRPLLYAALSDEEFENGLKDRFENIDKIAGLKTPVLFVHGAEDKLIPIAQARALFEAAPTPKTFRILSGAGHNDVFPLGANEVIAEWLAKPDKDEPIP